MKPRSLFVSLSIAALAGLASPAFGEQVQLPSPPLFPTDGKQCHAHAMKYLEVERILHARAQHCHEARMGDLDERWVDPGPCSPIAWPERCAPLYEQYFCTQRQGYAEAAACRRKVGIYLATERAREKAQDHAERYVRRRTGMEIGAIADAFEMRERLQDGANLIRMRRHRAEEGDFLERLGKRMSAIHRHAPGPSIAKHFFDQSMRRITREFQNSLVKLDASFDNFDRLDPKAAALVRLGRTQELRMTAIEEARRADERRRQAALAAERRHEAERQRQADLEAERRRAAARAAEAQRAAQAEERYWQEELERQRQALEAPATRGPTAMDMYDQMMGPALETLERNIQQQRRGATGSDTGRCSSRRYNTTC